ncbi:MAG TPA: hypothetical protein VJN93_01705 [Candidatus Acidoferrum sp.]|nr:hypothetical protein [Candidatus Acidoferrum sp.]
MYYIADTNVWTAVTQGKISCKDLSGEAGARVLVAPFMIIELMKSTAKSGTKYFAADQQMFQCMTKFDILELTKPFVYRILWNLPNMGSSGVTPATYKSLLQMMNVATSFQDFIQRTKAPSSPWKRVLDWHSIHEGVLDKELGALEKLADSASLRSLSGGMSKLYRFGGLFPDPDRIEHEFSAALEYLRASVIKLRQGANLAKNDRGLYVDFQTFFYLADPQAVIVSNEGFGEIVKSPQKNRIITLDEFKKLT